MGKAHTMKPGNGNITGRWLSFYRYPSSSRDGDFWGRHVLVAAQTGNRLHLESVPESKSRVTMDLDMADDGRSAKGVWREETEPSGYYKGAMYDGTIELEVSKNADRMSGFWHGKGGDGEMNTDVWELTKNGAEQPDSNGSGKK